MSASALLLRILLCVTLILNGSGYAVAATGMELAHLSGHAVHHPGSSTQDSARMDMAAGSLSGEQMPCHDAATSPPEPAVDLASTPPPPGNETPTGDPGCCSSPHCVCIQQLTATVPHFMVRLPVVVHAAAIRAVPSARAAPPIPHPIRPPIG